MSNLRSSGSWTNLSWRKKKAEKRWCDNAVHSPSVLEFWLLQNCSPLRAPWKWVKLRQKSPHCYPSCCSQFGSLKEVFYNSFCVPPAGPVTFPPVAFFLTSKPSHNNTKSTLEATLTESGAHRRSRTWLQCWKNTERYSGGLAVGCGLSLLNCFCWHRTGADWEIPAGTLPDSPFVWRCMRCQALWDWFWRTKCLKVTGRQSYFYLIGYRIHMSQSH